MIPPPDDYVSEWTIRNYFNWGGYYERMQRGDFNLKLRKRLAPAPIQQDFGQGTLTVKTSCRDKETNLEVTRTHHYESPAGEVLRRDKTTGGVYTDGRVDPKRLYHNGVLYHLRKDILDE